jgi:hypothetical protein
MITRYPYLQMSFKPLAEFLWLLALERGEEWGLGGITAWRCERSWKIPRRPENRNVIRMLRRRGRVPSCVPEAPHSSPLLVGINRRWSISPAFRLLSDCVRASGSCTVRTPPHLESLSTHRSSAPLLSLFFLLLQTTRPSLLSLQKATSPFQPQSPPHYPSKNDHSRA